MARTCEFSLSSRDHKVTGEEVKGNCTNGRVFNEDWKVEI